MVTRSQRLAKKSTVNEPVEVLPSLKAETKMDALRKTAQIITGMYGIDVVFRGARAYTNGRRIVVPTLPENADDDLVDAITGWLDHECAHIRFTDMKETRSFTDPDKRVRPLTNAIEDVRVNWLHGNDYRGVGLNIERANVWAAKKIAAEWAQQPAFNKLYLLMMVYAWKKQDIPFARDFYDGHAGDYAPIIERFASRIEKWIELPSTSASYEEAKEILAELDRMQKQPDPPPEKPDADEQEQQQESGGGRGQQDERDSSGESDSEQCSSEAEPDEAADGDDSGSSRGEQSGQDEQADQQGSEQADDDQADDQADSDDAGLGAEADGEETGDDADEGAETGADRDDGSDPGDGDAGSSDADEPAGSGSEEGDEADSDEPQDEAAGDGASDKEADAEEGSGSGGDQEEQTGEELSDNGHSQGEGEGSDEEGDEAARGQGETDSEASDERPEESGDGDQEGEAEDGVVEDSDDGSGTPEQDTEQNSEGQAPEIVENPLPSGSRGVLDVIAGPGMDENEVTDHGLHEYLQDSITTDCGDASGHRAFTEEFDRVIEIDKDPPLESYSHELDAVKPHVGVVAGVLTRTLLAQTRARTLRGRQTGRVSMNSIAQLKAGSPNIFQIKRQGRELDTYVELVVDHSGSMRGQKIRTAQQTCIVLAEALDKVGVPFGICGFTAGFGDISDMPREYQQRCRDYYYEVTTEEAQHFHRLDPIIEYRYKTGDQPFKHVKTRLALMAGQYMGANADGDSIYRIAKRVAQRKEKRKILIVLSDGFPAASQGSRIEGDAAERYMKRVAELIDRTPDMEVVGIGIHSTAVKAFYKRTAIVNDVAQLPAIAMSELKHALLGK